GTVLLVAARPAAAPPTVAERYDPATGAWVPTGSPASMWIVDSDAWPALLPNGRVLLVGLAAPGRRESAAEVYDPASGTWSATDPPPLEWPVVALVPMADARVLALGAAVHGGVSAAALYDATTGGRSATASPAAGRYDYQAIPL